MTFAPLCSTRPSISKLLKYHSTEQLVVDKKCILEKLNCGKSFRKGEMFSNVWLRNNKYAGLALLQ